MLETTRCSITEICFAVGYRDITSFSKLFKKNFNTTPEKYQTALSKSHFSPVENRVPLRKLEIISH